MFRDGVEPQNIRGENRKQDGSCWQQEIQATKTRWCALFSPLQQQSVEQHSLPSCLCVIVCFIRPHLCGGGNDSQPNVAPTLYAPTRPLEGGKPHTNTHLIRFLLRIRGAFTAAPTRLDPVSQIPHAAPTTDSPSPKATPKLAKPYGDKCVRTSDHPALQNSDEQVALEDDMVGRVDGRFQCCLLFFGLRRARGEQRGGESRVFFLAFVTVARCVSSSRAVTVAAPSVSLVVLCFVLIPFGSGSSLLLAPQPRVSVFLPCFLLRKSFLSSQLSLVWCCVCSVPSDTQQPPKTNDNGQRTPLL